MKKNHYLTLPRYKRKLQTLSRPMSRKEKLRNRRIQMIHIQDHLYSEDIYRITYNRVISMILGCQLKVPAHYILNKLKNFFPWYKYNIAKYKKRIKV